MTAPQHVRTPQELLDEISRHWFVDDRRVLDLMDEQWPVIAARETCPEDAESCRLTMLSASALQLGQLRAVWRARAQSRFVALNWVEGCAAIMMTDIYPMLAVANDGYPDGTTLDVLRPCAAAVAVLDELVRFSSPPGSGHPVGPGPTLIARFVSEKTGLLLLIEGRFDEAEACYLRALHHAGSDSRGKGKVRAGLELVRYLRDLDAGGSGQVAADATAVIAAELAGGRHPDMAQIAATNAERMRSGRRDVLAYEIL
jgi:hypothetical protein